MYKRHSIWDEDKWDIHSDKSTYAGQGSGSKDSTQEYHKDEAYSSSKKMYGSSDNPEDKLKDDYRSAHQEEEDKEKEKEDEDQEKTIVDTVEEEEKKNQEEEQKDELKSVTQEIKQEHFEDKKDDKTKRKQHKSIEEAINKAVKEEKETVFID